MITEAKYIPGQEAVDSQPDIDAIFESGLNNYEKRLLVDHPQWRENNFEKLRLYSDIQRVVTRVSSNQGLDDLSQEEIGEIHDILSDYKTKEFISSLLADPKADYDALEWLKAITASSSEDINNRGAGLILRSLYGLEDKCRTLAADPEASQKPGNANKQDIILGLMGRAAELSLPSNRTPITGVLRRLEGPLAERVARSDGHRTLESLLETSLFAPDQSGKVAEAIKSRMNVSQVCHFLAGHYCREGDVDSKQRVSVIIRDKLSELGVDAEEFLKVWDRTIPDYNRALGIEKWQAEHLKKKFIASSLENVTNLEASDPGSVAYLRNTYGIVSYGRYPLDLLQQQYRERDEDLVGEGKNYGCIIMPQGADHNGSLASKDGNFNRLNKSLRKDGNWRLKVIEANNKPEIARKLSRLHRKFGDISFAVVGAHGAVSGISFGNDAKDSEYLHINDLHDRKTPEGEKRITKHYKYFKPNFRLILLSCSTGAPGGIAQELAREAGAPTVAPSTDASVQFLDVQSSEAGIIKDENNNPIFDVQFREGVPAMEYLPTTGETPLRD